MFAPFASLILVLAPGLFEPVVRLFALARDGKIVVE